MVPGVYNKLRRVAELREKVIPLDISKVAE